MQNYKNKLKIENFFTLSCVCIESRFYTIFVVIAKPFRAVAIHFD
ncbi:hypothetical protein HFN_0562 [Helicobacter fennelliae MRY12-0050]|uniref:Uncharacterized protein n=1 Tax=Helicobacter fennelliae MRY12-0050 TaxID=1325130 RepID=T1D2K6_9HELI|nr:hypothetical protein HFN_0562 [Helicobacter fennelliae MRY12-0050]